MAMPQADDDRWELDIDQLVMQYLKSKSFTAAASAFEEELRIMTTKSAADQRDMNLFASNLEYRLGPRDQPRAANRAAAYLEMTPTQSLNAAAVLSHEERVWMPASPKRTRIKLFSLTWCDSREASRLREQHGNGDERSRVRFHDPSRCASLCFPKYFFGLSPLLLSLLLSDLHRPRLGKDLPADAV